MPLTLYPSIDSLTREELEAHITAKRARRLRAAIEYHEGRNAKLSHESDKIQRKMKQQYDMLAKEIAIFDKASDKIDKRLATIEALKAELGLVRDLITYTDEDESDD